MGCEAGEFPIGRGQLSSVGPARRSGWQAAWVTNVLALKAVPAGAAHAQNVGHEPGSPQDHHPSVRRTSDIGINTRYGF